MRFLSEYVSVKRRYYRSINLERDSGSLTSIEGYIPTGRAIDGLTRFVRSLSDEHSVRAWTLTGAYGTGKSSFAQFLTCLCGDKHSEIRRLAVNILKKHVTNGELLKLVKSRIPDKGLIRAVATAQREPVADTIVRAIYNGAFAYWHGVPGRKPDVLKRIEDLHAQVGNGESARTKEILEVISELNRVSKSGVLIIIDELGKNLEYTSQNQSADDLYLLQQIAEMPNDTGGPKVSIFGMLHQSFTDYAHSLGAEQRKEWSKIQGRFEDIPFVESSEKMIQLIGNAISLSDDKAFQNEVGSWAETWGSALAGCDALKGFKKDELRSVCPLHPFTALALPILCSKFSQNDRTLFTFLSSEEPRSFLSFIKNTHFEDGRIESLKLFHLYDYFVEAAGMSLSIRPQFQRWVEVNNRISDAKYLDRDLVRILKTVGILNLISTTGGLRASKETVALAMSDTPEGVSGKNSWQPLVDRLLRKSFVTWRRQIDELRIWEGSDFDIEKEILSQSQVGNVGLANLLNDYFMQGPLIARRHSYKSGTLRYYERTYFDSIDKLKHLECASSDSDGLIVYWLDKSEKFDDLGGIPEKTIDGKPVIIICVTELKLLKNVCHEYVALKNIESNSTELQSDGVARREVSQRVLYTERILEETLHRCFDISSSSTKCFCMGKDRRYNNWRDFQSDLSKTFDEVYNADFRLWNELINRRELSSQGAAARHKLITAMLENAGQKRLGIKGFGPEFSMFDSMLAKTGIYREKDGGWGFSEPYAGVGVECAWRAIEQFCKSSADGPLNVSELYELLLKPPYGVKSGVVPVLLASVLIHFAEHVSVYMDGNFIPALGSEHFQLFYRKPDRFTVKLFEISGLRAQLFRELEKVILGESPNVERSDRSRTILSIVKPLISFIRHLPPYTLQAKESLSGPTVAVRDAIINAKEPDVLLFEALPVACGLSAITIDENINNNLVKSFRASLSEALKELQSCYDDLLEECKALIHNAFKVQSDSNKIREDLRVKASSLRGRVIEGQLKRFILAAVDENASDKVWLESLVMVLSDKPPRVWKDVDKIVFESKLNDIARRFITLEALQRKMAIDSRANSVARWLTFTRPDGNGISDVVWIDKDCIGKVERIAQSIYDENLDIMEALTAVLIEKTFNKPRKQSSEPIDNQTNESKVKQIGE